MDFQQSKTFQNIQDAFFRKLNSSALYSLYADRARQEDYIEIAHLFDVTTRNEREHARIWWRQLNGGELPTTVDNLRNSIQVEEETGNNLYRLYAQTALEEGYNDISALFSGIANIDLNHSLDFQVQYEELQKGNYFCRPTMHLWICMQCGNILSGDCAPERCPVCGFPQGYYQITSED